jgi:thiamine transporter ThiT
MFARKVIAAIIAGSALAFLTGLAAPVVLFDAYAPDGPFGLYYGVSDGEMVATMLLTVTVLLTSIPAGVALVERGSRR